MQVTFYFAGESTQVLDALPWVRCASGNVLPKSGQKTLIFAVMVPDQLTSEWAGTHNFRGIAKFHKCFEKFGTSASK